LLTPAPTTLELILIGEAKEKLKEVFKDSTAIDEADE
jgi:hypothetical protein